MSAVLGVVAILVLTAATGYFVAQEFAYVSADRALLSQAADGGDNRAERALRVMGRLSFMLSGAQLGITVTGLVVGFIAEPALARLLEPPLTWAGLPDGSVGPIALVTGFAIATMVQMVLGELLPKNLALAQAEKLARALAPSTLVYLAVAGPLIRLFDTSASRLLRAVGVEPVEELHHGATLQELSDIIGESHKSGHLPGDLSQLLEKALAFGERTADEVMVPRPMVKAVPGDATVADLTAQIGRSGHTSHPVYGGGDVDNVVGVAGVRELADDTLHPDTPVQAVARPALLVPGSLPLHGVIERMRETGDEFACVVDEYGGLAGIVTFEDIAEELVGEIADENDPGEMTPRRQADGTWQVDAAMRVDEVNRLAELTLPDDDAYDTVAGLVMAHLSRLPRPGDLLTVELHGDGEGKAEAVGTVQIEVVTVARHVARQVRLRTLAPVVESGVTDGGTR
ncbi:hemolysin family protein [Actinomadura alba]|uniref:HlyC/CorC family transporter n=1 Tax=Actinomadura alba TaxID=406431 RepID=A0ABR7M1Y2_9ACTN|nr:hemolysin family protein [Actinomadura alba]MBC6471124.1 HlyC/CorC family transporter [Actinomadura alba]